MRITRPTDAPEEPFDATTFSGPVARRDYGAIESPEGTVFHVRFDAGSRTHWHSHPGGQVLFVTDGQGRRRNAGRVRRTHRGRRPCLRAAR